MIEVPKVNELLDLHGNVALVTGASGGIGRVIAQRLSDAGAAIAVHYHSNSASAEAVAAAISAGGGRSVAVRADVASEPDCTAMFDVIAHALGPVDIVVNNAADQGVHAIADMPLAIFQAMMATNLDGIFLTTRIAAAAMIARGASGEIGRAHV